MSKIQIQFPTRMKSKRPGGLFPEIVCQDGFFMSVQASDGHYCSPRTSEHQMLSLYEEVEVGFPSEPEELLTPYQDGEGSPVYGYVPLEVVRQIIRKHGGIMTKK